MNIESFKQKDWFVDYSIDQFKRPTFYVNTMSKDIESEIPKFIDGKQVLVHYSVSKISNKSKYIEKINLSDIDKSEEDDLSIDKLVFELKKLLFSSNFFIVKDIFNATHNNTKALCANNSLLYPNVHQCMSKLYDIYGYDIIIEELDKLK